LGLGLAAQKKKKENESEQIFVFNADFSSSKTALLLGLEDPVAFFMSEISFAKTAKVRRKDLSS
jgi:hypothetical protein